MLQLRMAPPSCIPQPLDLLLSCSVVSATLPASKSGISHHFLSGMTLPLPSCYPLSNLSSPPTDTSRTTSMSPSQRSVEGAGRLLLCNPYLRMRHPTAALSPGMRLADSEPCLGLASRLPPVLDSRLLPGLALAQDPRQPDRLTGRVPCLQHPLYRTSRLARLSIL